jgi:hypothetical protein
MQLVKIILITVELACIAVVILLAFNPQWSAEHIMGHFYGFFISVFTILAVTMQCNQQNIPWNEEEGE